MSDTKTMKGLDDVLERLKALPPEIASKRGGPVRAALRKGAVVVQKQAQANIHAVTANNPAYERTGTLESAVVIRRDGNPQRFGANERFRVLLSRKKYPDGTKAVAVGRFLEFGTERQAAEPWATPAYFQSREQALNTVVEALNSSIEKIIRKLKK